MESSMIKRYGLVNALAAQNWKSLLRSRPYAFVLTELFWCVSFFFCYLALLDMYNLTRQEQVHE